MIDSYCVILFLKWTKYNYHLRKLDAPDKNIKMLLGNVNAVMLLKLERCLQTSPQRHCFTTGGSQIEIIKKENKGKQSDYRNVSMSERKVEY